MKHPIAVITTFPTHAWPIYAKQMVESYIKYWPVEIPLLVALDDDLLANDLDKMLRANDGLAIGMSEDHKAFIERNKDRDDPKEYRKQAVRFCHKVFAIKYAVESWQKMPENEHKPRYLIWIDADVLTARNVSFEEIEKCLPDEGKAVAYLGRKDWDHSECGWLAFDLRGGGIDVINKIAKYYTTDTVFEQEQWHDSYLWDLAMFGTDCTNLTKDCPGMEIWPQSPMAPWSKHYKGPIAKQELTGQPQQPYNSPYPALGNMQIMTKNAVPDDKLHEHIRANQELITKWIRTCKPTDEEIIVVSAGPMMVPEHLYPEIEAGKRIVAVKHALDPLKEAGITPWACILLDPRDHMNKFVENPNPNILWFVASQVPPSVTKKLLDAGCTVWGYHASVGAGEQYLTDKQFDSIVSGGSATATRGLYMLAKLGFHKFSLYGYDLCFPNEVDLTERDDIGQPKYLKLALTPGTVKREFWTKPEFAAQFQEFNMILNTEKWQIKAYGHGIIPFLTESLELVNLRRKRKMAKMNIPQPIEYEELLYGRGK